MRTSNIIDTPSQLAEWLDAVAHSDWVAIDTEFLRERTYVPQLCLIQVAADTPDGELAVCIDVLKIEELSSLESLLSNSHVSKIFHSCRQDLEALDTRLSVQVKQLYDTQLAAAFCGYGEQVSYAALVDSLCAVQLPKSHTRADWSQRPLPAAQLEYALDDVKYLPALRQRLDLLLKQKGRLEWHRDECAQLTDPAYYRLEPDHAWQRLKGIERLNAVGQSCAQKLAGWREQKARARNLPRGWVLPTAVLLQICRHQPRTLQQLANIQELNKRFFKRNGREIIELVKQSETAAPHRARHKLTAVQQHRVKELLQLLERRAEQFEISRSLLANRQEIENFVCGATDLPLFKGWRAQLVGDEILAHNC